jgi:homoserine O-acetyltransferase
MSRSGSSGQNVAVNGKVNDNVDLSKFTDPQFHGVTPTVPTEALPSSTQKKGTTSTYFSAQQYLRYQGEKFVKRFDGNCYIAITRKLDTHDVSRGRVSPDSETPMKDALAQIKQPTLIIGIESDGLFTFDEQQELAAGIPNARLRKIDSPEGHDAFLLQFEQVNHHILEFLNDVLPDIQSAPGDESLIPKEDGAAVKDSVFGEAEVEDITAW